MQEKKFDLGFELPKGGDRLTDEQAVHLDDLGFVPGPSETESDFISRIRSCLRFIEELPEELKKEKSAFPFRAKDRIPVEDLKEGLQRVKELHKVTPSWVPAFYHNKALLPWQGGGAWIIEIKGYRHPVTLFQLRAAFRTKQTYLGLYDRNELLAHEYSHVGRMAFEEHDFEEILSYQSSPSRFRRYWGPVVNSGRELAAFFAVLMFSLFAPLFSDYVPWLTHPLIMVLPFLFAAVAIRRLSSRWRRFRRCIKQLSQLTKEPLAVAYRLTDTEIRRFATLTPDEIRQYAEAQRESSLRWRVIHLRFF